jgi:hypothetical protein
MCLICVVSKPLLFTHNVLQNFRKKLQNSHIWASPRKASFIFDYFQKSLDIAILIAHISTCFDRHPMGKDER